MSKLFNNFNECLVSSQRIKSDFFKVFIALNVISSKFPMGVETMYKPFNNFSFMFKFFIIFISYLLIFINSYSLADEKNKILKVGLLAPFSGEYKDLGQSIMLSLQLALDEIGDDRSLYCPRDSGSNNEELLINSIEQLKDEDVKIIIGPINYKDFPKIKKYSDLVFISPSNTDPKIQNNILVSVLV